jgi:hypothetical protein
MRDATAVRHGAEIDMLVGSVNVTVVHYDDQR